MEFGHYADAAVTLVNAPLPSVDALRELLAGRPWLAARVGPADPGTLRVAQSGLAEIVDASARGDGGDVVIRLNRLLAAHTIHPRISGHDSKSWHLHVTDTDASVAEALIGEALFGLMLLVTEVGATRLGRCAAPGCRRAFVDTSTNHSRRFCSTRCSTRTNVANHRRRLHVANISTT
jgi:predicted RNA-binding Zn ribbon-like protein